MGTFGNDHQLEKSGRHHSYLRNVWTTYDPHCHKFKKWNPSRVSTLRCIASIWETCEPPTWFNLGTSSPTIAKSEITFFSLTFTGTSSLEAFSRRKFHFILRELWWWWWWTQATYSCCSIPGKTDNSKSAAIGWVLLGVSSGVGYMRQYTGIPVKTGGAKRQDML